MRNIIILGFNAHAKKLAAYLEEDVNTKIIGFCKTQENVQELTTYPILNSIEKAIELSRQYQVSDIYSTIAPEDNSDVYRIMKEADRSFVHFRLIPEIPFLTKHPIQLKLLKDIPVLTLYHKKLMDINNRILKRAFDIIFSLIITIFLLAWLIPMLAIIICIDSRGPAFFIQQRTGRRNKTFSCIKFRTMRINEDSNNRQATLNDSRITRIGRFLRSTNLDELPQFINVLKGDMSLVGPRPHMLKHTYDYSNLIDGYMVRHWVKPGITGWAQINGYRGETKFLEQMKRRVEYDIWYLHNWSFLLDMRIIYLTILSTFKGDRNAY